MYVIFFSSFFCFTLPAGAQIDPKLHEGGLHGENGSKGLCLILTHPTEN